MTTIEQPCFTAEQRRDLEAAYRQQIGSIKALARLLGYPCPIASRAERRTIVQELDDCGIVESVEDASSNLVSASYSSMDRARHMG